MIPFENIDAELKLLEKDRAWLAETSGRSADSIRGALAPNAPPSKRSELLQKALTDAIERELAKQAEEQRIQFETPPEIPAGHTAIYLSGQTYEDAEHASRIVGAPTLAAFCHDVIKTQARLIITEEEERGRPMHSLKVAEDVGNDSFPSFPAAGAPAVKYPPARRRKG